MFTPVNQHNINCEPVVVQELLEIMGSRRSSSVVVEQQDDHPLFSDAMIAPSSSQQLGDVIESSSTSTEPSSETMTTKAAVAEEENLDSNKIVRPLASCANNTGNSSSISYLQGITTNNNKITITMRILIKLHNLLCRADQDEDIANIISWQSDGLGFIIHKMKDFNNTIIPRYFKGMSMATFQRQLNLCHFSIVSKGINQKRYYHDFFLRDQPELCKWITPHQRRGGCDNSRRRDHHFSSSYNISATNSTVTASSTTNLYTNRMSPFNAKSMTTTTSSSSSYDRLTSSILPLFNNSSSFDTPLSFSTSNSDINDATSTTRLIMTKTKTQHSMFMIDSAIMPLLKS